jgi:hypothetical protein
MTFLHHYRRQDSNTVGLRQLRHAPYARSDKSFETQRIHKSLLNFDRHKENCDIAFDIAALYNKEDGYIDIPASFISYRTLVYVGLSESKIDELWMQWTKSPPR